MSAKTEQTSLPYGRIFLGTLVAAILVFIIGFAATVLLAEPPSREAFQAGQAAYLAENYPLALAHFSEAINTEPNNPDLYIGRGLTLMRLASLDEARVDFEQAIELADGEIDTRPYVQLGFIAIEDNNYELAVNYLTTAIDNGAETAQTYFSRGQAHVNAGNYETALPDLEESLRLSSDSAITYLYIADVYYILAQWDEALAAYERYVDLEDTPEAYAVRRIEELQ